MATVQAELSQAKSAHDEAVNALKKQVNTSQLEAAQREEELQQTRSEREELFSKLTEVTQATVDAQQRHDAAAQTAKESVSGFSTCCYTAIMF